MSNHNLTEYIEKNIFPLYDKNDSGHGMEHITYVIRRCIKFAPQFENINIDMLYTAAAFHDIAHHIDKATHEILSAECVFKNEDIKQFFTPEQRELLIVHLSIH